MLCSEVRQTSQVFCWENLWQTAKGWRGLQGFQCDSPGKEDFSILFLLLEEEVISTCKTLGSDHRMVSGAAAAQGSSIRGSSFPPPPLGTAARAHPAPAGAFLKPLCPELVPFGVRADLVSPGSPWQRGFFLLYWVIKVESTHSSAH